MEHSAVECLAGKFFFSLLTVDCQYLLAKYLLPVRPTSEVLRLHLSAARTAPLNELKNAVSEV
jgi:hypothetical protein